MKRNLAVLAAALAVLCPGLLSAQACLGVPTADRQTALQGGVGFTQGMKSYGAGVSANLQGPLSVYANYNLLKPDNIDTSGNEFGAGVGYELAASGVSLCPAVGASYARFHEEFGFEEGTVTSIVVPLGLGIGKLLPAGANSYVTVFGAPQFLYLKTEVSYDGGLGSFEVSDTRNEFGGTVGLRYGTAGFYLGGAVSMNTIENSDPIFSVGLGFIVGGNR